MLSDGGLILFILFLLTLSHSTIQSRIQFHLNRIKVDSSLLHAPCIILSITMSTNINFRISIYIVLCKHISQSLTYKIEWRSRYYMWFTLCTQNGDDNLSKHEATWLKKMKIGQSKSSAWENYMVSICIVSIVKLRKKCLTFHSSLIRSIV